MSERYYVLTCTGWPVTPRGRPNSHRPGLTASVLDSIFNHQEVISFRSEDRIGAEPQRFGKTRKPEGALAEAERVCRELNDADEG
jgi:hypothetical protein